MTDLHARADRVRQVVEGNFSKVHVREGSVIEIEVPADIAPGLASIWAERGFSPISRRRQRNRLHAASSA